MAKLLVMSTIMDVKLLSKKFESLFDTMPNDFNKHNVTMSLFFIAKLLYVQSLISIFLHSPLELLLYSKYNKLNLSKLLQLLVKQLVFNLTNRFHKN